LAELQQGDPKEFASKNYRLAVAPHHKVHGATSLQTAAIEQAENLTVLGFDEALRVEWPTDAHFVTYYVHGPEGEVEEAWPRINKRHSTVLQEIRLAGGDIKVSCFVFDWDTSRLFTDGKKRPLTQALFDKFIDLFLKLPPLTYEWATKFTFFYTTKNGVRLVYALKHPMPADRAEMLHKLLVRALREGGVLVDEISDWTRLFRLPRILRTDDDGSTYVYPSAEDYYVEDWQYHLFDPVPLLGEQSLQTPPPQQTRLELPQPSPDDILLLIGVEKNRPDWWGEVKKALREKLSFTTIYEHRSLAPHGSRDITIQRFAGEVCCALAKQLEKGHAVGPGHVYAMLYPAVVQLDPDEQTPDWTVVLWRACLKYWAAELGKLEQRQVQKEVAHVQALSLSDEVLAGMRVWCPHPEVRHDDVTAIQWASERLIVATPSERYHVMRRNGTYDSIGVKASMLKARIRELGMEPLIPLGYQGDKGWVPYSNSTVVDRHGTVVQWLEGHAGGPGNFVRGFGSDNPVLVLKLYSRRTDITAQYDERVDEWLRILAHNDEGYRILKAWIGHALAFDEGPIAACALVGSRGVGKKMLASGLAEAINTESFADSNDLGNFQAMLMRSPFVVINEGVKRDTVGYDPADIFRLMTGGDPMQVNMKFRDPIVIRAPSRVLVLANNLDVLSVIAGRGRNLSKEDKLALAQRLVVIRVHEEAQAWNRQKGGKQYTKGWISDDHGGISSDFVLARHFLHLYETRPAVPHGNRFLVEGDAEDQVVGILSTRSGHAPQIIETLVAAIEAACQGRAIEGVALQRDSDECFFQATIVGRRPKDGEAGALPRVWITANAVSSWQHAHGKTGVKPVPQHEVTKVYRGLARRNEPEAGRVLTLTTQGGPRKASWWNLDLDTLLTEAYELGYQCAGLEKLVSEGRSQVLNIKQVQERVALKVLGGGA
jgi:hypothetical protein